MALHHSPVIVPPDIWNHVAQFISREDLCSMFGVNQAFFRLSMDAKYSELTFRADSSPEELWALQRIRDPAISHRVRHLYIDLQYGTFVNQLDEEGELNAGWIHVSTLEGIQMLTETVASLTNVTGFSLQWDTLPIERIVPFFIAAWKSFGSGLRSLSFVGPLNSLVPLLTVADGPVVLRELNVTVHGPDSANETHEEPLSTALAPFVNKVAPTLHSFSYSSFSNFDITRFFHGLKKIPNLERLFIYVNIHGKTLAEPLAATHFLCDNATTLRHLDWEEGDRIEGKQYLIDLQGETNLDEVFSNLYSLRIGIPKSIDWFAKVVQLLRYSAETLTSLELFGYTMTYQEVNTMVSLFAPQWVGNLRELRISIESLTPELILFLAKMLPSLVELALNATYFAGHEGAETTSETITKEIMEDPAQAEHLIAAVFADTLRTHDISSWRLRDIDIQIYFRSDFGLATKFMTLLAECVPSVETFKGEAKESYASTSPEDNL